MVAVSSVGRGDDQEPRGSQIPSLAWGVRELRTGRLRPRFWLGGSQLHQSAVPVDLRTNVAAVIYGGRHQSIHKGAGCSAPASEGSGHRTLSKWQTFFLGL